MPVTDDAPQEWLCPHCNSWVGAGWWRHVHVTPREPTLEDMIASRERGEAAPDFESDVFTYMRTGKEPKRIITHE